MAIGFGIYFLYSRTHSRLATGNVLGATEPGLPQMLDDR
jgi:hypothetical protein